MPDHRTARGLRRRSLLLGTAGTIAAPRIVHGQATSVGSALVIGNSKYHWEASLPNVRRDAPDVAQRFRALGLNTELMLDVDRKTMIAALDKLKSSMRGTRFAAVYFAGHGVALGKGQFLVPVDADLSNPSAAKELIPAKEVSESIRDAGNHLLVFDSCRNNPADGWRQVQAERAAIVTRSAQQANSNFWGPNWVVLYSTAPGRTALDGPAGQNSPFAASFLRQLDGQSVDVQALPAKLRRDLLLATEGRQVLFSQNNFSGPFVLTGNATTGPAVSGSSWASDPARLIELPNAYAFARDNKLPLPLGLVAHRPAGQSKDSPKVGSFKYIGQTKLGRDPAVLVVLSVEEQKQAQMIVASKGFDGQYNWRFVVGTISGNRVTFVPRDEADEFMFDWKDAGGGSLTLKGEQGNRLMYTTPFTRLD
jgi:hypothetical protein